MAGEAAGSGLRFFLDRGLGAFVVPGALRAAGWTLETMDERYGADQSQRIQDTQWIEEATLAGDVLLCKDLAIAQNPLEAQAVYMTGARAFALSNAAIAGPAMAQWYLDNEAKIVRAALRAKGPYVMAVNPSYGLRRARLAYPPDLPCPAGATVIRAECPASARRRLCTCRAFPCAENLCHQAIFVDHASGAVALPDIEVVQAGDAIWQRAKRCGLVQAVNMRPARVVEVFVLAQDGHEVALAPDQGPVRQFASATAGQTWMIATPVCAGSVAGALVAYRQGMAGVAPFCDRFITVKSARTIREETFRQSDKKFTIDR